MNSHRLLEEFLNDWPIDRLRSMQIDEYTNLKGTSFITFLQYQSKPLGESGGFGYYNYQLFVVSKPKSEVRAGYLTDGTYIWRETYGQSAESAFETIQSKVVAIAEYASKGNFESIENIEFSNLIKWKIAFLYSGYRLLNIYKPEALKFIATKFNYGNVESASLYELHQFIVSKKPTGQDFFDYTDTLWRAFNENSPKLIDIGETNVDSGLNLQSEKGFRIIAIKTGRKKGLPGNVTRISQEPLKLLDTDTIYSFYSQFDFPENSFTSVSYNDQEDLDLYYIDTGNRKVPLHVNAIVGENGSGKSTLIELLYIACYNMGCAFNLLRHDNGTLLKPLQFVELEIFYQIDSINFSVLRLKEGQVYQQPLALKDNSITSDGKEIQVNQVDDLHALFYTVAVNYSHYSLNSGEIGEWITSLFHKNDGYQTPIVINPMRNEGNIDINNERRLLVRRLLANVLQEVPKGTENNSLRNIGDGKVVETLSLRYSKRKFTAVWSDNVYTVNFLDKEAWHWTFKSAELEKIIGYVNEYFGVELRGENKDDFYKRNFDYILEKLLKICKNYRPFRRYLNNDPEKDFVFRNLNAFIRDINKSNSHIAFKIKGAILWYKYRVRIWGNNTNYLGTLRVDDLSKVILEVKERESFWVNTFMMSPPAYYDVEIGLIDNIPFESLSSGEKQRVHSISSIAYHIINLNSVGKYDSKMEQAYKNYDYINIVLDEIELYYHPEWQRGYLRFLTDYLGKIDAEHLSHIKGINLTLLTHSPFILSDIPHTNVLKLKKGRNEQNESRSFGSNIHELLADSFFMEGTFMGEYAKEVIEDLIKFLKGEESVRSWSINKAR
ncbi:MAG: hypothetical protein SFW35_12680 [Chitinophagales bacterium]|nr:hypothetical protein [Chitinophagales bacterium]